MSNEHEFSLPPLEDEVMGRRLQELEDLADDYDSRAEKARDSIEEYLLSSRRASLEVIINRLRALEIFRQENPSEGDMQFAKKQVWLYKVNKRMGGLFPTHPSQRAYIGKKPTLPTKAEIQQYQGEWNWQKRRDVFQEILNDFPDPDGKVWNVDDLSSVELPD